jgi:multicomponent K+:H+ antiporter subunit E
VKRWLPSLPLSAALWALWLLLNDSLAPAHVLLGLVLALLVPWMVAPLKPPGGPLRRPLLLARLILRVGKDVILSALDVMGGILRSSRRPPQGTFVAIPLDLRDAHGLAALAIITSVIPGTVWSELSPERDTLLLHVFDLDDEATFIAHYKADYELPLKEIFG